jgi:tight adherence protein C
MTEVLIQTFILLFLGFAVFFLIWSLFRFPVPVDPPIHRILAVRLGAPPRHTVFEQTALAPVVSFLLGLSSRMAFPGLRNLIRRKLDASGNPSNYSTDEYITLCVLTGLLMAGAGAAVLAVILGPSAIPWAVFGLGLLGFAVPLIALDQAASRRLLRIAKQLPYSLDLIALVMAAGATFTEAIETLIRDEPDEDLNQELRIVQAEIEFGSPRAAALANMANRIPLDALRSVVGAVIQAEALGTPLAVILKNQSGMLRMHRSVRAEKLSASANLRILIPSMLILIAVVLIVFGPVIVRWVKQGTLAPAAGLS